MMDLVIKDIISETSNIKRFILAHKSGLALPTYQPGAHIVVKLPSGLERQYSLCRLPTSGKEYEIAVLEEPNSRGGSKELHKLTVGTALQAKTPQNHFLLANPKASALLFAAGIGITPIIPMAQMLKKSGTDFQLHYSAKRAQQTAFFEALHSSTYCDKVTFYFSESERINFNRVLSGANRTWDIYVCGPANYIEAALSEARKLGWPEHKLHREFFAGPQSEILNEASRNAFQVKIASTGEVFDVEPGMTITETLEMNGIYIPTSCEEGWCGTCMTPLLEGVADHRDTFLSDSERYEGKIIMPCCSRARSDALVLDL
ncbi:oxidoreductase [Marinomonas piezotolerans]|uniref:Oxidoreductase n=1 Tax=Marinomonas piezotolerans TaxID=2213058 RepID=A0A370U4J8_9GAMM|nr:PDR/VanB family oxidoreductase [Marinomonas piezotolerans]RDL42678.1 oxidoreductase [Marinomonas piezotolerans]